MNRLELREYVESITGMVGSPKSKRLPRALVNKIINDIQLDYFKHTCSLDGYSQTIINEGQFEYALPSNCIDILRLTVEDEVYEQRVFPMVVDAWEDSENDDQVN